MAEREADPKVMLADKGYDTDNIRGELGARGAAPEIPTKRNRARSNTPSTAPFTPCETRSNGSSTGLRKAGASQRDTTHSRKLPHTHSLLPRRPTLSFQPD